MRAVITVIGKDNVGILAKVSNICSEYNANVMDVTQSVLQEMFAMIMMVDISKMNTDFVVLGDNSMNWASSLDFPFIRCTRTYLILCIVFNIDIIIRRFSDA